MFAEPWGADAKVQLLTFLAQAEKVLLDYYLITPLDVTTSRHLVKPSVQGWEDNILDVHPTKLLSVAK